VDLTTSFSDAGSAEDLAPAIACDKWDPMVTYEGLYGWVSLWSDYEDAPDSPSYGLSGDSAQARFYQYKTGVTIAQTVLGDCVLSTSGLSNDPSDGASLEAGVVTISDEAGRFAALGHEPGQIYDTQPFDLPPFGDVLRATGSGSSDVPPFSIAVQRPSPLSTFSPSTQTQTTIPTDGTLSMTWSTDVAPRGFLHVTFNQVFGSPTMIANLSCDYPIATGKAEVPAGLLAQLGGQGAVFVNASTYCVAHATTGPLNLNLTYEQDLPGFGITLGPP
jgi:hypothetical protein